MTFKTAYDEMTQGLSEYMSEETAMAEAVAFADFISEEGRFHENWRDAISAMLPGLSMAGWGNYYDGGTISLRRKMRFLKTSDIGDALKKAFKKGKPLNKTEIFSCGRNQISGASGRCAQIGVI